jgi:hypothetical protein
MDSSQDSILVDAMAALTMVDKTHKGGLVDAIEALNLMDEVRSSCLPCSVWSIDRIVVRTKPGGQVSGCN